MKKLFLLILICILPSIAYGDLIGHWTLDGNDIDTKGRILDRSGTQAHGYASGISTTTYFVSGKIGQGVMGDGVNDCILMGDVAAYDFASTTSFTVSNWYKRNDNAGLTLVVSKKGASGAANPGFYPTIGTSNGGQYEISVSDGVNQVIHINSNRRGINNGRWTHLAFVVDRNNQTINSYVDGIAGTPASIATVGPLSSTSFLGLGVRSSAGICSTPSIVALDDVRIYNEALGQNEISVLSKLGVTRIDTSYAQPIGAMNGNTLLVFHMPFDGNQIRNGLFLDTSGKANHGTASNIATTTFYAPGVIGQGVRFDGTNNVITVLDSTSLDSTSKITISIWIRPTLLDGAARGVISKRTGSGASGYSYSMFFSTGDKLNVDIDDSVERFASNTTFLVNKWYHVVLVYDGTLTAAQRAKLYINGTLDVTSTEGSSTIPNEASNLLLGFLTAGSAYYQGNMDDVRIYKETALTASEVKQLYNSNSRINPLLSGILMLGQVFNNLFK